MGEPGHSTSTAGTVITCKYIFIWEKRQNAKNPDDNSDKKAYKRQTARKNSQHTTSTLLEELGGRKEKRQNPDNNTARNRQTPDGQNFHFFKYMKKSAGRYYT